ncbi:uncharacterized protein [Physcomitrium patens]|nr:uncharacterized protein LOC112273666 isoform X1 [Physcomitrium patens]|eukprot:XP_024358464.1 uncharacterized protein LOC112273666 isoform X1 [Physcomitrella patens]
MALSAAAQLANFVPNSVLQSISNSRHLSGSPSWAHILVRRFTHMSLEGFQEKSRKGYQHGPLLGSSSRRLSNVTVAAERSPINGFHESPRPIDGPRRKVVEHVVLLQMEEDMTDEQEKDMLDHLYSLQYHYRGILAVSLGRVVERMPEGVTHAFFQRFPSFEALEQYMDHPARLQVAEKYINPYCKGRIVADFEAEVEDDLEPLFRRGERFQQGIEHVVLIKVREGAILDGTEGMIEAFNALPQQIGPSVIVQLTAGTNLSDRNKGYTHGVLVRVPSEEALTTFSKHPAYVRVFTEKVLPISSGLLSADFLVDPVTKSSPL